MGEHQSNGEVENTVQIMEGQIRTMKLALEHKYRIKVVENHHMLPWLIIYAAFLYNRFNRITLDGRTTYERCNGKT